MHRLNVGAAAMFALGLTFFSAQMSEAQTSSGLKVDSSTGRSYQEGANAAWSTMYAGHDILVEQPIVTASDGTMKIKAPAFELDILPLSVARIISADAGSFQISLGAGAVRVLQQMNGAGVVSVQCPFATLTSAGAQYLIDGNRVSVALGSVHVVNAAGNRRTVSAGESLTIFAAGFLPQPQMN